MPPRVSQIASGLFRSAQLLAVRRSWSIYQSQNLVVEDRGLRIPVSCGIGLDLIGAKEVDVFAAIRWVLERRRGTVVDVGANIGRVLIALARTDRTIPYTGIEPQLDAARSIASSVRTA